MLKMVDCAVAVCETSTNTSNSSTVDTDAAVRRTTPNDRRTIRAPFMKKTSGRRAGARNAFTLANLFIIVRTCPFERNGFPARLGPVGRFGEVSSVRLPRHGLACFHPRAGRTALAPPVHACHASDACQHRWKRRAEFQQEAGR